MEEVGIPIASWIGVALMIIVGLAGFLLKDAYFTLKKDRTEGDDKLKADIVDLKKDFDAHILEVKLKHAEIDKKLNETSLQILIEINAVRLKLAEFKADNK